MAPLLLIQDPTSASHTVGVFLERMQRRITEHPVPFR